MWLADLHVHSNFSDGKHSIPEVVDFYGERGFGAIAITDHVCEENSLLGKAARYLNQCLSRATFPLYIEILKSEAERAKKRYNMLVIPGIELSKNTVSNSRSAHVLGLGLSEFMSADGDATTLARKIRAQGGLSVAAHPVSTRKLEKQTYYLWSRREELRHEFDAWEVASGQHLFHEVLESGLPMIATSDLHSFKQIQSWKTVFEGPRDLKNVFESIRNQNLAFEFYRGLQPMLTCLAICGCVLWFVSTGFTVYGTLLARRHFRTPVPRGMSPPISILKPLKGLEPRFEEAIESFFRLKYRGEYELLFCVSDPNDPALSVVRKISKRYPTIPTEILIGEDLDVPNPKAGNTHKAYEQASYDLLLISDSNVIVNPNYLDEVVPLLKEDVGLVTGVVSGVGANTTAGFMEAATLNTFSARWMLIGSQMGAPIVMGKSMLFSRNEAERFGGLRTLGLYLAEDYMAGHAMTYLNKKVSIMNSPVQQIISDYKFKTYWSRHVRWGRLRRAQAPLAFFAEPIVACTPIGFLGAVCLSHFFNYPFLMILSLHYAIWLLNDLHLIGSLRAQRGFRFIVGWVSKELLYLPLWLYTLAGQTVQWRGRRLKVEPGGLLLTEV